MRAWIKVSDMIAGVIAAFVALVYVTPQHLVPAERIALIAAALVGLYAGWRFGQDRHWIPKIFLYVGAMLMSLLVVDVLVALALNAG